MRARAGSPSSATPSSSPHSAGERLWSIAPATSGAPLASTPWFTGELGRLRDVTQGPDGELWFIGNNTDGRGSPSPGDDRLFRVRLAPA